MPGFGTAATLLRGAKWILAGFIWPPTVKHAELAVALLRYVAVNFKSYSTTPQHDC
jgi:hypothetical protein